MELLFPAVSDVVITRQLFIRKLASIFASSFEGCAPENVPREGEMVPGASLQHSPDLPVQNSGQYFRSLYYTKVNFSFLRIS